MSVTKILVVCEGPTDFVFIEGIVHHIGEQTGKKFDVKMLAPQIDATTGKPEPHGWTGVKRWCSLYGIKNETELQQMPETIRARIIHRTWKNLVLASNAQFLLVQLDTDITHELDVSFDSSKESRRECCTRNICSWLGVSSESPDCKFLLPTYAIENWLLATYDSSDSAIVFSNPSTDYESFADCESMLIQLGYASKASSTGRRLKKDPKQYKNNEKYLPRLLSKIDISKTRCQELDSFITLIATP